MKSKTEHASSVQRKDMVTWFLCDILQYMPCVLTAFVVVFAKPTIYSNKHMLDSSKGKARCQSGRSVTCGSATTLSNEEKPDIQQLFFFLPFDSIVDSLHLHRSCPQELEQCIASRHVVFALSCHNCIFRLYNFRARRVCIWRTQSCCSNA